MISCKFFIPNDILNDIDTFSEESEFNNISFFENADLGFSDKLDENGFPIAKFFDVEILVKDQNESEFLKKILESKFKTDIQNFKATELKDADWVDLYTKELKPVLCDKFYFYNESIQKSPDDDHLIPIKLNSALAFGSGHHQTTQGCLMNAVYLNEQGFSPNDVLDMGCGTGILGICALKIWGNANLLGIDIDPEAVRITNENYKSNDVVAEAVTSDNVSNINAKFDLILCNILKQPLIDLCENFCEILNENGYIITSGFIKNQENEVVDCYESFGFELENRIQIDDWLSILFKKHAK